VKGRRIFTWALILGLLLTITPGPSLTSVRAARFPRLWARSNGNDTYHALVIGVPLEDIDTVSNAGAVNVLYGAALGLSGEGDQFWHQDVSGVVGAAEEGDQFGFALAAGDFNGDGYFDLAVGVPYEDVGDTSNAGLVQVFYATADGLSSAGNEMWNQGTPGIEGGVEEGDGFGYALAAGDFNGDGYDDLAVGVPFEDKAGENDSGAVNVIYGSADGLTANGNQIWDQDDFFGGAAESGDEFGYSLAAGDFNGDGYDDLAIGAPSDDWGEINAAGVVNVLYGSSSGLSATGGQTWSQADTSIDDSAEESDNFGYSLAAGDFNGDGRDDLAIGVPGEDVDTASGCGAVNVLYALPTGGLSSSSQFWHQDPVYVRDGPEDNDWFGSALAAGDFDGDGYDDLAVGVPGEDVDTTEGTVSDAGAVNVLYGSSMKLQAEGGQFWHQDIIGTAEEYDNFGFSLAAGDFNGDGHDDLAIGVPFDDLLTNENAGVVNVIYGFGGGLGSSSQLWYQGLGILDTAEEGDHFGYALVTLPTLKREIYLPLLLREVEGA